MVLPAPVTTLIVPRRPAVEPRVRGGSLPGMELDPLCVEPLLVRLCRLGRFLRFIRFGARFRPGAYPIAELELMEEQAVLG